MKTRWWIALAAGLLAGTAAAGSGCVAYASDEIRIIGESEEETAPSDQAEDAAAEERVQGGTSAENSTESITETVSEETEAAAAEDTADAAGSGEEKKDPEDGTEAGSEAEGSEGTRETVREEAEKAARSLYSSLQKSADLNDNQAFSALFAEEMDPAVLQSQLQAIKSALNLTSSFDRHSDFCFFVPSEEAPSKACAVSLTDYTVTDEGGVNWYSTLLCVEQVSGEWKVSSAGAQECLDAVYPVEFTEARAAGYNAVDLYPYFAMRFEDDAVFEGAFYSLPCMFWQNSDGSVTFGLWLSNGQGGTKWCDSIDLNLSDSQVGTIADVNIPVQTAVSGQTSSFLQYSIPAEKVRTGNLEWTSLTVRSNLIYE